MTISITWPSGALLEVAGTCYRAHDPRRAFKPTSGDGAAMKGARFNPRGVKTLYLALSIMTAIKEANQGFAHRIDPCVLCSYDVDCEGIADLTTEREGRIPGIAGGDGLQLGRRARRGEAAGALGDLRSPPCERCPGRTWDRRHSRSELRTRDRSGRPESRSVEMGTRSAAPRRRA
ncbi:hypothetical protein EMEDMD4_790106 [Sinorhizobium medicae]|uniref:RES domain-containing protein n=1 Tax=Sinorhizobium medicae TaxID=110321 RepID=A0A508X5M7_9HYPH|nr:hypothetical protein EMEDMD4_790106 [Sinorhizobium medicae]